MGNCQAGECTAECADGCGCVADPDNPMDCDCFCYCTRTNRPVIMKGNQKVPLETFKPKFKVTSKGRYNICTKGAPITGLAQFLDKFLPNKILVPANRLNKKITLSLKNKTVRQIIDASGLVLKS